MTVSPPTASCMKLITARESSTAADQSLMPAPVAAKVFPGLGTALSIVQVERITTVALIVILFDGGLHIGLRRFRHSAAPILSLGTIGTFATAGLVAAGAERRQKRGAHLAGGADDEGAHQRAAGASVSMTHGRYRSVAARATGGYTRPS